MLSRSTLDPSIRVGSACSLGEHVVIGANVQLGDRAVIGHHVVIHPGTVIGDDVRIGDHAVLGRPSRPAKGSSARVDDHREPLRIGSGCTIGCGAVIAAGSTIGDDTLIGDQAFVRERVRIGSRVLVGRGSAVENDTTIGDNTRIQTNAYITAYMTIEAHVFIAPGVTTTNDNSMARAADVHAIMRGPTIRRGARIGGGSTLLPRIEIGEEAFVAAGSVVTRNVPPRTLVMGAPARVVRTVPAEELLV
jgi:acetyltransferase-like isoleucine patch superfamily enzyme